MTRAEIANKLSYVKNSQPKPPKKGDCYELNEGSISQQIKNCKEGINKIFFLEITEAIYDGKPENWIIHLALISENVYLSPTKY